MQVNKTSERSYEPTHWNGSENKSKTIKKQKKLTPRPQGTDFKENKTSTNIELDRLLGVFSMICKYISNPSYFSYSVDCCDTGPRALGRTVSDSSLSHFAPRFAHIVRELGPKGSTVHCVRYKTTTEKHISFVLAYLQPALVSVKSNYS